MPANRDARDQSPLGAGGPREGHPLRLPGATKPGVLVADSPTIIHGEPSISAWSSGRLVVTSTSGWERDHQNGVRVMASARVRGTGMRPMGRCVAADCASVTAAARLRLRALVGAILPGIARVAQDVRGCRVRAWRVAFVAAIAGVAMSSAAGAEIDHGRPLIVARGLDNPRGLAFLPTGSLAVAEAGHAGDVCLGPGFCVGLTGQVVAVKLHHDRQTVLAAGLPSEGGPFAPFGLGGLAVQREKLFAIVGLNPQAFGTPADYCPDSACLATVTAVQNGSGFLNKLRSLRLSRGLDGFASVGSFDFDYAAANPDPGNPEYTPGDANPFGLTAGPRGGFYVVDAASNTLDYVTRHGEISVLVFIPSSSEPPAHLRRGSDLCRTDSERRRLHRHRVELAVALGRHHADPGPIRREGRAGRRLHRGRRRQRHPTCSTRLQDWRCSPSFDEKPFDGSIVKVTPDLRTSYLAQGLDYPTGITLGPDDQLYVT